VTGLRAFVAGAVLVLVAADAIADKPEFTSTWKAPEATGVRFAGKKVAALVISSDQNIRVSAEEQLVSEIGKRGVNGVATYRMAPAEELTTAERARPWFERAGVEGVIALRPVSAETEVIHSPSQWVTNSYYSTLWGYYGYGWSGVYVPGSNRRNTTLVIETLIFSLPLDKLLWAGISTTTNPEQQQTFMKQLVEAAVNEMKKQRLIQ
jgi:hypothetical protein